MVSEACKQGAKPEGRLKWCHSEYRTGELDKGTLIWVLCLEKPCVVENVPCLGGTSGKSLRCLGRTRLRCIFRVNILLLKKSLFSQCLYRFAGHPKLGWNPLSLSIQRRPAGSFFLSQTPEDSELFFRQTALIISTPVPFVSSLSAQNLPIGSNSISNLTGVCRPVPTRKNKSRDFPPTP